MNINKINSAMNYILNKFCPILMIAFLVFLNLGTRHGSLMLSCV